MNIKATDHNRKQLLDSITYVIAVNPDVKDFKQSENTVLRSDRGSRRDYRSKGIVCTITAYPVLATEYCLLQRVDLMVDCEHSLTPFAFVAYWPVADLGLPCAS